jgi:hypothetical protein
MLVLWAKFHGQILARGMVCHKKDVFIFYFCWSETTITQE